MRKILKALIPSLVLVVGVALYAAAQSGLLIGLPIVGGASYCSSTVNAVCVNTVAAGPTVITGNENIGGDTNLSASGPSVVKFSMASLNLLPDAYQAIVAGSAFYTYTFPNNIGSVTFTFTGAISDERVTAPPAPVDGQRVCVNSTHTITALQFIANTGQSLAVTTPTVLTASTTVPQGYCWRYRSSNTTWYRAL